MRTETRIIVNNYYTKEEITLFKKFAKIIDKEHMNKEKQREIWEFDQKKVDLVVMRTIKSYSKSF